MKEQTLSARWLQFCRERFPLAGGAMSAALLAVSALSAGWLGLPKDSPLPLWTILPAGAACFAFLLRLRIMDEDKDYQSDREVHPERPLARGLLSRRDARWMAVLLAVTEAGLTSLVNWQALLAWLVLALFSLLMYKEFFIAQALEKSLLIYALSHCPSAALAAVWLGSLGNSFALWQTPAVLLLFAGAQSMLAMLYDVSRKTWEPDEESDGRSSYSRKRGKTAAAALAALWGLFALLLTLGAVGLAGKGWPWLAGIAGTGGTLLLALLLSRRAKHIRLLGLLAMPALQLPVILGVIW